MNKEGFSIDVQGMSCGHCSAAVERLISAVEGVEKVEVNLEAGTASIQTEAGKVSRTDLVACINNSELYKAS